jgi:hypothetical protein
MRLNLTDILEQVSIAAKKDEKLDDIKDRLATQAKPYLMKLIEQFSEPAHLSDVSAQLDVDHLKVINWQRVKGLRLAPVQFNMGKIDNPDAAQAFVDELEGRKESVKHAGRFFGLLDYWAGWAGLVLLGVFLTRWLRQRIGSNP